MSKLKFVRDSLFSAPAKSVIIHAVNCKGIWGSGIAKQFAIAYPKAYDIYQYFCAKNGPGALGSCLLIEMDRYTIACLFTSEGYGRYVDPPEMILKNTKKAIDDLIAQNVKNLPLHTCKINSGLFRVPWEKTEKILLESGADFTVYEI